MKRTQIQLTEQQARALKAQARLEERSVAELVRESVAEYLGNRHSIDTLELQPPGAGPERAIPVGAW